MLRYLEHLATLDSAARGFDHTWYETHGSAWVVRDMRLLLWNPPALAEELQLATWLSGYRRVQATREYCVWQEPEQRLVARAQGRWAYVDRERGLPLRIPEELIERFGATGHAMPQRPSSARMDVSQASSSETMLVARSYEADTQRHINNTVYMDWLGEALTLAAGHEQPLASTASVGVSALVPRYYHIQYMRAARPGDHVRVMTQLIQTGSRRLAVSQEIREDASGQVLVQCHSEHLKCL
jgi:acyl-CoA thioesterase FadM